MLVLVVALAGAGVLVTKNQQLQRGATYANVDALFLPSTNSIKIGDEVTTTLMLDLKSYFLTGVDLRIKYNSDKMELKDVVVLTPDNFKTGTPIVKKMDEVLISENDSQGGTYNLVWTNLSEPNMDLPSGVVGVVKFVFMAKTSGKVKVELDGTYKNQLSGYNAGGSDLELGLIPGEGALYMILGDVINEPTKIKPSRIPTKYLKPTIIPVKKIQIPM